MSLQAAAQHLASKGRGPDTMLIHMAPQEVAGLQALAKAAGGTLTVNPDTGLAEAGFLKNLLPTLIGVGLTAATGGALAPWMIGLGIGGLETVRTGSLEKGLMAGLGAYGGAGIGAGLSAAGAASPAATAQALGTQAATGSGSQAAMLASQNAGFGQAGLNSLAQSAGVASGAAPVAPSAISAGASALGTEAGRSAALSAMGGGMGAARYGMAAASPMMQGPEPAPYDGGGPNPYQYTYEVSRPSGPSYDSREARQIIGRYVPYAAGGPVAEMSERNAMQTLMANGGQMYAKGGETDSRKQSGSFLGGIKGIASPEGVHNIQTGAVTPWSASNPKPTVGFFGQPITTPEPVAPSQYQGMTGASADAFRYLMGEASASPATLAAQQTAQTMAPAPAMMPPSPALSPGLERLNSLFNRLPQITSGSEDQTTTTKTPQYVFDPRTGQYTEVHAMASGGIAALAMGGQSHLGDYSDGGRLLKGPGDGVSDSIPATIADKRPARLADGEFVVPARIVSELGNGSTEAGARKLYAMMDRIQKARGKTTGKNRVAVDSRAEKALPA